MIKAPRNHTSVYFTDYLKSNWDTFTIFRVAKGFTSFNGYNMNLITNDFQENYHKYVHGNINEVNLKKRLNIYDDTKSIIIGKFYDYTDGEVLDLINKLDDIKDMARRDLKRRGVKL